MLQVYSCIVHEHDWRLLLVAAGVCFLSAFTAFAVYDQARAGEKRRVYWASLAALVSGIGIWSTHFIAMLAYKPNLQIGYDFNLTLISIITAVLVTGAGWAALGWKGSRGPLCGGLLISTGIGAMHYLGMAGMHVGGRVVWDQGLVVSALVLGTVLSCAALAEHRRAPLNIPWRAALLLTLAICCVHFISMAAAGIIPDTSMKVPTEAIRTPALTVAVTAAAFMIILTSFAVVLFDRNLAQRAVREALGLQKLADALKRQADISSAALDNMAQGLSMFDAEDLLVTSNRRYADLYSLPDRLLCPGTSLDHILAYMVENAILPSKVESDFRQTQVPSERPGHMEVQLGCGRIIDVKLRPLDDGGWVATHEDVTERSQAAEQIAYLARHDSLTNLPNRVSFGEYVQAFTAALGGCQKFAIHTIDLDRFKEVNDTLGHPAGDQILKQVAVRLKELLRDSDKVARLGGDEFAVIQADVQSPADAAALAERIVASLSQPFAFDGHTVVIGASVGIAFAPQHGTNRDDLLKNSDLALYRAKAESRGTVRVFEAGMDLRLLERRELETDLRVAIQQGQFELHYQPVLNLTTQTITGFEALIRWHHPTRGLLQPLEFIATAEETGLIIPIGEWVLRQACRDAAAWPSSMRVAVNLSAAQFKRGDILAVATSALAAARLSPERLELEITESVLLNDEAWVLKVLQSLRRMGIRIAMDDFGTGYSSLNYLRTFPFTKIKIDRAFVSDLAQTTEGLAIIQATIQLSAKLGMVTTAEGVETLEQMNILALEGCTEIQGFHISCAVPADEVAALIKKYSHGSVTDSSLAA